MSSGGGLGLQNRRVVSQKRRVGSTPMHPRESDLLISMFPLKKTTSADVAELRPIVEHVMQVADTTLGQADEYAVRYRGQLTRDSIEAFEFVAERFRPLGYTPLFRKDKDGTHLVIALRGIIDPPPSNPMVNLVMFLLTVASTLFFGGLYGYTGPVPEILQRAPETLNENVQAFGAFMQLGASLMLNGWPFAVSILAILLAHEFGHYFAARYHKMHVTLPYFIPFPFGALGTMGAVIQLKSPPVNKRSLLDVGVAGPLAGFIVAIPILIYGLATSEVNPIPVGQTSGFEGNSLLYVLIKYLLFGRLLPEPVGGDWPAWLQTLWFYVSGIFPDGGGTDVYLNQVAWAGWGGLLVTGLNLIPAGQLDGGHALYVLIGRRALRLVPIITGALVLLGFFWPGWFLWAAIIFFLGRVHAEPLDQITELDARRRVLAVAALVLFVLLITPVPIT